MIRGDSPEMLLGRSARMIDGVKISIEKAPWQVFLMDNWGASVDFVCGGSIISSNWVVTAGHCCCESENKTKRFVSAGSSNFLLGSRHSIVETICHPLHELRREIIQLTVHDIAVVRVAEPFIFDETRQPVPLYVRASATVAQAQAIVSGWGAINIKGNVFDVNLKSATMNITSGLECETFLSGIYTSSSVPTGQICAEPLSGMICFGDSGGPLTVNGTLVGIVSWANGTSCTKDYPAVFTEVARYRYWISEKTLV